jgi:hypothetical protein
VLTGAPRIRSFLPSSKLVPQMSAKTRSEGSSTLRHRHNSMIDPLSKKDALVTDDQDAISSLSRTRNMLQTELERVSHLSTALDSDGQILTLTKEEYESMQEETKGAKSSLYRLKRLEMQDSIIFWSAVAFFYIVCLYIICSRIRVPFLAW